MLNTVVSGTPGMAPPLLIAHGLFGSARNWGAIAKRLGAERQVLSVDMRNHGASKRALGNSYADMAADLAEVIAAHGGRADVLGHSMGGKAAMVLALTHPERVARLVVADIAPVGYAHTQMALIRAMEGLDLSRITTRRDADAALAEAVPEEAVRAFLLQSLDLRGEAPRWLVNLAALRGAMTDIMGFPEIAGRYEGAVLFLRGGLSDYIRPEHAAPIRAFFPAAGTRTIPDVGHWLHAEKPREFVAEVATFLKRDDG